ncbi:MAG: pyruvate kinase alpha/beta domain-containing protein [Bacillota bacterium]
MIFDKPGADNTQRTVELAVQRARELGIKHIVAASYRGFVAEALLPYAKEFDIAIVGQVYGFGKGGPNPMTPETRAKLESAGMKVLFTTHVLSGAERGLSTRFNGVYPVEIIAHTLRMLGQGTKVSVEVATMAFDAGLVPEETDIIALAGTGQGSDTALVMRPAHAQKIMETKIHEVICKPRLG